MVHRHPRTQLHSLRDPSEDRSAADRDLGFGAGDRPSGHILGASGDNHRGQ